MGLDVAERRAFVRMLAERIEAENDEVEAIERRMARGDERR